jgi:hypothetical protein
MDHDPNAMDRLIAPDKAAKIIRASKLLYNTPVEVKVIQEVKQHPYLSPF